MVKSTSLCLKGKRKDSPRRGTVLNHVSARNAIETDGRLIK